MAYTSKSQALDAICRARAAAAATRRGAGAQPVVPASRRRRRPRPQRQGPERDLPPPRRRRRPRPGGPGAQRHRATTGRQRRHRRTLAALSEIAALLGQGGWAAGPVRLFGAGDSRFADGRQGTPPYDSGYVLHRYSALNLAVWALCGKVVHDARTDLFATSGCSLEQWIELHLAGLLAAVEQAANPLVLVHLGTHSLPWASLDDMQAQATEIIAALTGAGARVLWLLENPRSGGSVARAREGGEAARLQRLAHGRGGRLSAAGSGRSTISRTTPPTGTATGGAARAGLQRDDLHDTQAGASSRPPPPSRGSAPCRRSRRRRAMPAPPTPSMPRPIRPATASAPESGAGEIRDACDTGPGSGLACTFSTETAGGRTWMAMQLGGPAATASRPATTRRPRRRLRRRGHGALSACGSPGRTSSTCARSRSSSSTTARLFRHQHRHRRRGTGPGRRARGGARGTMVLSANPSFFQVKLMVEAAGPGPVSGTVRWADPELRRVAHAV